MVLITHKHRLYHGTGSDVAEIIERSGLVGQGSSCAFVTDSLQAASEYARLKARLDGSEPVIFSVDLPEVHLQPNGRPAPPFYADDWHVDSGMDGQAWEYDAPIDPVSRSYPLL